MWGLESGRRQGCTRMQNGTWSRSMPRSGKTSRNIGCWLQARIIPNWATLWLPLSKLSQNFYQIAQRRTR